MLNLTPIANLVKGYADYLDNHHKYNNHTQKKLSIYLLNYADYHIKIERQYFRTVITSLNNLRPDGLYLTSDSLKEMLVNKKLNPYKKDFKTFYKKIRKNY